MVQMKIEVTVCYGTFLLSGNKLTGTLRIGKSK